MRRKIYFAGSIRGGREKQEDYFRIIRYLQEKHEVLTEIIGDKNLTADGDEALTDREIYERDAAWLRECDTVIAECTVPSLGVGYELAYAEKLGKQVLVLFWQNGEKKLSAMVSGNDYFEVLSYRDLDDLLAGLAKKGL